MIQANQEIVSGAINMMFVKHIPYPQQHVIRSSCVAQ